MPTNLETPYEDESPELRPPTKAFLKKGWNLVLVKLPIGAWKMPEYRLVKWQFSVAFVQKNGVNVHEIEGLIYSPDKKK